MAPKVSEACASDPKTDLRASKAQGATCAEVANVGLYELLILFATAQSSDEDRIKMTEILLDKMYSLGLIQNTQSLEEKFC